MFLGEYKHCLDGKNRFRIPPKFVKDFASEGMVLTKGNDGCLFLLPKSQFAVVMEKTSSLPMFDKRAQMPLRMLFSSACELEGDNQGRVLLPANLKTFADIQRDIIFVGVGNRVEIWALEKWQEYTKNCSNNFDQIVSDLGEYGI